MHTPSPVPRRPPSPVLVAALLLAAALAPLRANGLLATRRPDHARSLPRVRHGATFHSPYLLRTIKGKTRDLMLRYRILHWKQTEPVFRVRADLEALRGHDDWQVRRAAIEDLTWFPSVRVEEALIDALRDPTLAVRERAVVALGEVGTNRSIRPLIDAMGYTPGPVRDTINHTLYRLTGEWYGRHRDRWVRWYRANEDLLR